jgi:HAE1 family hydrophobic/amphiphilic exporter-1
MNATGFPPTSRRPWNISEWSIRHPFVILSVYIGVAILAGAALMGVLPRRMMPYVESPMIGVVTMMPGLSAEEMEIYISKPIEERMVDVKNVRYIRSTSQDGFSIVSLEFYYHTDMKKALVDVQALMNVVQADLPVTGANLKPSWVIPIDPLNLPVLSLALTGKGWDPVKLKELADNQIVNRLKTVPNVQSVTTFGGLKRQLQVVVDRNKLAAYGFSLLDVKNAIDAQNVSRPGGVLTKGPREASVRVDLRTQEPEEVPSYPVGTFDGRVVYMRDVGRVEDAFRERRSAYHVMAGGKIGEAIEVNVLQQPDASSPQVIAAVNRELDRLKRDYPGIDFQIAYDNSHFVGILMRNMAEELAVAVLLTGIALLFFLGNGRATVIAMTAVPTSLAMAVLLMIPFGLTLNSSTLIGLLLSIGRLVDDSIIDLHSVERHLRMGKDPERAAVDGITEVRLAVMASTFMLCLALAPLLFTGGLVQDMFVELVWPIIFGLLSSMLVSFTLTSLMAARLLRAHDFDAVGGSAFSRHLLNPFQRWLERVESGYQGWVRWSLEHRFITLTRVFATIAIGFAFYSFIGSEMMPLADVGQAYGVLEAQPGTSFAETERMTRQFENILAKYPEIETVSSEIGFESGGTYFTGYAMGFVNASTFMITLKDKDDRKRDIWKVIDSAQAEAMRTIPGLRRVTIKEMGSDVMASSAAPISLLIYGQDLDKLYAIGQKTMEIAKQTPGFQQPYLDWAPSQPTYKVEVDRARAAEVGLTPQEISDQAYYALRGGLTNEYWRLPNQRQLTILVRYEGEQRGGLSDLEQVMITTKKGKQVPLKSVATVRLDTEPTVIEHDQMRRVIYLNGFYRIGGKPSMDLSMEVMGKSMMVPHLWPPGYGVEMRGDMTQMMDSFARLYRSMALAVVFIFLVLVAQFRGFLQPLQMVFSLPLELSGVFFMLWLNHQTFSTVSLLAVVILTGMDITVAILLIDHIMRYREEGMPRDEAVIRACPERLRPIVMTSLITILTMVPVAFFPRMGLDAYSPLGTVIIGGLLVGTVLSLFDIPVLHTLVDDFAQWVHRAFGRETLPLDRRAEIPIAPQPDELQPAALHAGEDSREDSP